MYRIEVGPGEETVFRTIEELAVGIRNGVITPRARIYHSASQKWLPIGLHPHYKKAMELPAASASPAPVMTAMPTPSPSRLKPHPPVESPVESPKDSRADSRTNSRTDSPIRTQPQTAIRPPETRPAPEPSAASEPKRVPKAALAERVPAPVQSPVIAMQQEVLRDLQVVSIPEPEPLPWQTPSTHAAATAVQVEAPSARAATVYEPRESLTPVEHPRLAEPEEPQPTRPALRRSRRGGGRPVVLLAVAGALVIGTQFLLTATPPASAGPTEAPAPTTGDDRVALPSEQPAPAVDRPVAEIRATELPGSSARAGSPRPTTGAARAAMVPGPAFAGSAPVSPGADSPTPMSVPMSVTPARVAPAEPAAAALAPAPEAIELALPELASDSVVPASRNGDTLGMKKLLRALNGAKPAVASEAP